MGIFLLTQFFTGIYDFEEEDYDDDKPLWEKLYDFYQKNEKYIMGGFFVGSLLYSTYNFSQINNKLNYYKQDIQELERRIHEQKTILLKMDDENSKIKMWFSQSPKLPVSRKYTRNTK